MEKIFKKAMKKNKNFIYVFTKNCGNHFFLKKILKKWFFVRLN
jgi:hypothetical protein